jgi:hypothetical protein
MTEDLAKQGIEQTYQPRTSIAPVVDQKSMWLRASDYHR